MRRLMVGLALLATAATGRTADDEATSAELQQIVEQSAARFEDAFGKEDAAAVAALFTEQAQYVDASGTVFHGRAAIESEFAAAFELNAPGAMSVELISIRPIAEGVLVEDGVSSFTPDGGGPISQTKYTATHVKQADSTWLLASVRELSASQMAPHDRLQALAWLIGDWHEDVEGSAISTRWKWSDDGNFLISEFSIRPSADVVWTGSHRIGWDAERRQFRSWVFESSGGAMGGWWRANDDGSWSVQLSGADAEGVRHSSTLTYQGDGADALVVTQDQRIVGGESLPGSVHRAVRQPPEVGASTTERQ